MKTKILCFLIVISISCLYSQGNGDNEKKTTTKNIRERNMFDGEGLTTDYYTSDQTLAKKINPKEYVLGPGDLLFVNIGGMIQESFPVEVLPEEVIILPNMGVFVLKNKILEDFKKDLKNHLQKFFKKTDIAIFLVKLRTFRIYITGNVGNPGTYFVQQVDRLSDIVNLAGGFSEWADKNNITVENKDSTNSYSLDLFLHDGDIKNNPLIIEEDRIHVPSISFNSNVVKLDGDVLKSGFYPISEGELLTSFLKKSRRLDQNTNLKNVELVRDGISKKIDLINLKEDVILQNGDLVLIQRQRKEVYVSGEVIKPGAIPYHPNYTAWDYIALAGHKESSVDVDEIKVIRFKTGEVIDGRDTIVFDGDIVRIERKFREDLKDYINVLTPIISLGLSAYAIITR